MQAKVNGDISFWYADIGGPPAPGPPLQGDMEADVAIVGAGFTGLWTAYYLRQAAPSLRVVLLEKEFAGFGASGRNGGQLVGGFAWSREKYLATSTRREVLAMQDAMAGTVDEIIAVAERENIDADILRVDNIYAATNAAQLHRVKAIYEEARRWDASAPVELIGADAARARINVRNVLGAMVLHGAARVQPAKLVRGLAVAARRMGAQIFEQTTVLGIEKGKVTTDRGSVRAPIIIRATEGFTAELPGQERSWLPLNSAQIVTEPLPQALWEEIGWKGHELLSDKAHTYCYAQRTREGCITLGGRGVPYRFGSRTDIRGLTQQATIDQLHAMLVRLLPQTSALRINHAWCGVLAVPRDWCTTVGLDPQSGIGWAGGYVGMGVSSSNLFGRTLRDLVLGRDTELARLPWVNRAVRRWEPEPLRWLGVHGMYRLYRLADNREHRGLKRSSRLAAFADRLTGR